MEGTVLILVTESVQELSPHFNYGNNKGIYC